MGKVWQGMAQRGAKLPAVNKTEATSIMITDEVIRIEAYVNKTWGMFHTEKEVRLSKLFPRPSNRGLIHIWRYGTADIVIYRQGQPVCIIEPGGSHHWDERQAQNDRRKWKLAEINNVRCLQMLNGLSGRLSRRKWRGLLGQYLFGQNQQRQKPSPSLNACGSVRKWNTYDKYLGT